MKRGKIICRLITICFGVSLFTACSPKTAAVGASYDMSTKEAGGTQTKDTLTKEVKSKDIQSKDMQSKDIQSKLEGKSLFVYCGAGMTKPFTEIAEDFEQESGAAVAVTYANAAQIISQITATNEGDLFVAGDQEELAAIQEKYVAATKNLVKHIPVIAVQTGNPKGICTLKDFAKIGVKVVLGDSKATPIGKIADKALTDAGVLSKVNVIARAATSPEIATALSLGHCDTAILWKENTNVEGLEVVVTEEMDPYIKVIPAASLKCSKNTEVLEAFLAYLDTEGAKTIWKSYGYELSD